MQTMKSFLKSVISFYMILYSFKPEFPLISGFWFSLLFWDVSKRPTKYKYSNAVTMIRMAGSKLLARLLLLISSITLISLLALARCGIGGLVENNLLLTDDGKWFVTLNFHFKNLFAVLHMNWLDVTDAGGTLQHTHDEALNRDQQNNYMILLEQREEENRQEIAKLTAEIKALKVQLLQHRSKCKGHDHRTPTLWIDFDFISYLFCYREKYGVLWITYPW